MAYTTGSAANHYDLLIQLKTYLLTQGWTVLNWSDDSNLATNGPGSVLNVRGPGAGADQQVFLNIQTVSFTGSQHFSLQMSGALSYTAGVNFGLQPMESRSAYLNLWNASINYWFFVNDRRVIIVAKTSTVYSSAYLGFFLPWGNPAQYPSPFYIGGDYNADLKWSDSNTGRRMFCDPGGDNTHSSAYARGSSGLWVPGQNTNATGSDTDFSAVTSGAGFQVWPWACGQPSLSASSDGTFAPPASGTTSSGVLNNLVLTAQNERFVFPATLLSINGPPMGALDGVFATQGAGLSSEATVSAGGRTFVAFQNVNRTSGNDFFLVEQL